MLPLLGTGEARYNHLNGDTYCYLCGGCGWRVVYTPAEQAAIDAEAEWVGKASHDGYRLRLTARRLARLAAYEAQGYTYHRIDAPEPPDPEMVERWVHRSVRNMPFWVTIDHMQDAA